VPKLDIKDSQGGTSTAETDQAAMIKSALQKRVRANAKSVPNRIPPFIQKAPKATLDVFNAESKVIKLIDDKIYPVSIKIPSIIKDIDILQKEVKKM